MIAEIQIKNRPAGLQVRKVDAYTDLPLAGAHFALYRQVTIAVDGHQAHGLPAHAGL